MHIYALVLMPNGSDDARLAIYEAASFLAGARAVVLWRASRSRAPRISRPTPPSRTCAASTHPRTTPPSGSPPRAPSTRARPALAPSSGWPRPEAPSDAIVGLADELDAWLIVLGSRGRRSSGRCCSAPPPHHVSIAPRPTLVIPSPTLVDAGTRPRAANVDRRGGRSRPLRLSAPRAHRNDQEERDAAPLH